MLKQISRRRFSKSSQTLLIILIIVAILAVFILMLSRQPSEPIQTDRPLGVYNQSKEIGII